ncbi:cytochrome P450 [Williamsia herbipolensis]|uniref:Cytochrome P450 n=1 Tax=Williamsia herbipolensis TaxID=1603258 RepID=A0AAU4K760_9NOCA|nr:cytochrome P450 [Williamsia herbipolensis]
MTATVSAGPHFTLRSGPTWRDPFGMYADLRTHAPVHHTSTRDADFWVLTRHSDVTAAAADTATFSSAGGLTVNHGELEAIGLADNPPMVMLDPPVHTDFRRMVARGFTPRQVESLEPVVRAFVVDRIERLRAEGSGDIVAELFKPLPSMVVAHYLGVPESDRASFDRWTDAVVAAAASDGGFATATASAGAAIGEMMAYFDSLITHRRTHPGDDTVSQLVAAGIGAHGDTAGLLSILAFTFTMVTGGNDTTTGMLGGAVQLLHTHRDQRQILIDDPGSIRIAVEELLRLTSPVQGLARTTTRDVEFATATIPAGAKVLLCYGAANRDHDVYGEDAEDLDVTRDPRGILTFSHGAHHCLGAAAARMQARVALEELLRRCPNHDVDLDTVEWAGGNYVRRPTSVMVHAR